MNTEFDYWFNVAVSESEAKSYNKKNEPGMLLPGFGGSAQALCHYISGSGDPLQIDFFHISPFFVKLTDFEEFTNKIEKYRGKAVKEQIGVDMGYAVKPHDWLTFGNIALVIDGMFQSDEHGWVFDGRMSADPDTYNFDLDKTHRSKLGQYCTEKGGAFPGKEFKIIIKGSRGVHDSGRR